MSSVKPDPDGAMTKIYKVNGMSCRGCERSVELSITSLPGVGSATANALKGELEVVFLNIPISSQSIKAAIEACGFEFDE